MSDWEDRDLLIDSWSSGVERDVEFVFGRFLAGLSDDPRQIVFDILLMELLDAGLSRIIEQVPLRKRAIAITRTLPEDLPAGSTTGLEDASRAVKELMLGDVRDLAQEIVQLSVQMTLFRKDGFKEAVENLLESRVGTLVEQFGQALLVWDRAVLDRVADLQPEPPVWVYSGPADKKNRPFCRVIVRAPRAYTREAIERLNEHPDLDSYVPPNVFMLCGGFNCRHVFLPISREHAKSSGLEVVE